MRTKINFLVIFFCLLQFACERHKPLQDNLGFKGPTVVEAQPYKVPLEKMTPPIVIPVHDVKTKLAGKPEIIDIKINNKFAAKPEWMVPTGKPETFIPGRNGLQLPVVVPAIDSPFLAGLPEIVVVQDPYYIKENNPESFSSITSLHGLKSNIISSLLQDRAGNLWISTWDGGGVSKYDGRSLTNYSTEQGLSNDWVNCIFEDKAGNMWFGTESGGVNKFDGRYITRYSTEQGLSDTFVWNIMQDSKGDIWFATNNGLNKYDGYSFTHYTTAQGLPHNVIRGMLQDSKGKLWFGVVGGVICFDGQTFENYTDVIKLPENTGEVISIIEDKKGNYWFGTNNIGIFKYNGQFVSHFTSEGGLSSNNIAKIIEDNTGNLWITAWSGLLNKYNGKYFEHFGVEQGLSTNVVFTVLEDKSGNIWLGTGTGGVYKYDGKLFTSIQPAQGLSKGHIECIGSDIDGNIWTNIFTESLNKYDGKSITRFTTDQGLFSNNVKDILGDNAGNIWLAVQGGVDKYDGMSFTHYGTENGLNDGNVYSILEDKKGNLWFGTQRGLCKFDGKSFTWYFTAQGLSGETIYSIFEDHNSNLWIGTKDNGLNKYDGHTFTHYSVAGGLSNATVNRVIEDENNNIWLATNGGVNKFDGKNFTWFRTEQGLSNNIVTTAVKDGNGDLWFGTVNGLNRLKRNLAAVGDPGRIINTCVFKKYTQADGFSEAAIYTNSLIKDRNGNIWIGAHDRLTQYHPKGDIPDTIPPTIQLSGVALFDESINWRNLEKKKDSVIILSNSTTFKHFNFSGLTPWHNQPENLQLAYNNNYITFQFIGITTNRPKEVRYQYFLEGLDENWSIITDRPEATYNNLPPARYTLKVKAVNSEGYWSKELKYSFTVLPPWWETGWAYILYVLVVIVAGTVFIKWRERTLRKEKVLLEEKVASRTQELQKEKDKVEITLAQVNALQARLVETGKMNERLRISRELHDDIGGTLSGIVLYSHLIENQIHAQHTDKVEQSLNIIQQSANDMVNRLSDIVWSVNPEHNSINDLVQKIEEYATEMTRVKNMKVDVKTAGCLAEVQLPVEALHNTYFLCKEAINNAVKYSNASILELNVHQFDYVIEFSVKDNGEGFDMATVKKRNGLINMQKRAAEIGAQLYLESTPQQGTQVSLQYKITQ